MRTRHNNGVFAIILALIAVSFVGLMAISLTKTMEHVTSHLQGHIEQID